jgi:hypothetical protein
MEPLVETLAEVVRRDGPMCISCLARVTRQPHLDVRRAVMALALAEDFTYKQRCGWCGTEEPDELPIGLH